MSSGYEQFANARLAGEFSEMGSFQLVLPRLEGQKTLDIGCADGLYLRQLSEDSVGLEQMPALVAAGQSKGLTIVEGSTDRLETFESGGFDAVLYSHVLEHVDSPIVTLRQVNRVLRRHGTLVLGLPIERNLYRDLLRKDYFAGTHIYAFSIGNAKKLLAETGFKVTDVIYHLPKCRSQIGLMGLRLFNVLPLPFRSYFSMGYWVVAKKG